MWDDRWHNGDGDKTDIKEIRAREARLSEETGFRQASDAVSDAWREYRDLADRMLAIPIYTSSEDEIRERYDPANFAEIFGPSERIVAIRDRMLAELAEKQREHLAYLDRCGVTAAESAAEAAWERVYDLDDQISATTATSVRGIVSKVRHTIYMNAGCAGERNDRRLHSVLADLERLA